MATAIGKLMVKIAADAVGVQAGIDSAKGALGKFGDYVSSWASDTFKGGLFGMASRVISGAFSTAVSAASLSVETLVAKWGELAPQIDAAAKNARRLGITTSEMMGLEGLAGEAGLKMETFVEGMLAARGQKGGDIMAGIFRTADVVKALGDPTARIFAIKEGLGIGAEKAAKMVTLFEGGAEGLKKQLAWYSQIYSLTDAQANRVEAANDAWQRTTFVIKGFWTKVVAGMAPAIETVNKLFHEMGPLIVRVGGLIGSAIGDTLFAAAKTLEGMLGWLGQATGLAGALGKGDDGFKMAFRTGLVEVFAKIADGGEMLLSAIYKMVGAFARVAEFMTAQFGARDMWGNLTDASVKLMLRFQDMAHWANRMDAGIQFGGAQNWMRDKIWGWFAQMDVAAAAARAQAAAFIPYSAVGAQTLNSKEAFTSVAKFLHEGMFGRQDIQQKQLEEQKGIRKALEKWMPVKELKVDLGDKFKLEEM